MSLVIGRVTKQFILAGDATWTVERPNGTHATFRFQRVEASDRWPEATFVKLLTGPDNTSDFTYAGKLDPFTEQVVTTAKSAWFEGTEPHRLLNRILLRVWQGDHEGYERHGYRTHHEGRCGRCGRKLTVPSSVESGIGPECAKHVPDLRAFHREADLEREETEAVQAAERADEERRCRYKVQRDAILH